MKRKPEGGGSPPGARGWRQAIARLRSNASTWGLLEYGIGPLLAIVSTPLLFRQLGAVGFGQFAMVMALAGFGNAANLGAAVTATKLVSEKRHEPDGAYHGAAISFALIGCALAVVTAIALAGIGATLALDEALAFGGLEVSALAAPALAVYLCQQLDQLFIGCLKGHEDFAEAAICETVGKTLTLAAACLAAGMTHSATWASSAQALGLLATAALKMVVFARHSGRLAVLPAMDKAEMSKAFKFSGWSWLNSLSSLAFNSIDRVMVGALLGPTILAIYTVGVQIGQIIHTVAVALFQKAMPIVSRLSRGTGGPADAAPQVRKLLTANILVSTCMTAVALAFSQVILGTMLNHELAAQHLSLFRLLIVASGLLSMNVVSHFSLLGLGHSKAVALLNGAAGLAMALTLAVLAGPLAELAAAYARIFYSGVTLGAVWLVLRYLHGSAHASRHATVG